MYPELAKAGGLSYALDYELAKVNSSLKVAIDDDLDKIPFAYARVEKGTKFSQVYIAAEERLFLTDFWRDGVCLGHGNTDSISNLAKVVDFWLNQNASAQELAERYSFVKLNDKAKAFDENREVEYTWNFLAQDESLGLNEFVELASRDEVLNKLFPFTSLYTLCFSRCTGYPYDTNNLPNVTPEQFERFATQENRIADPEVSNLQTLESFFVVTRNKNEYLGKGNAVEALKIVKDNLPVNIKPAVKGTADN